MKVLLYIATVISIITYLFWGYMPKGSFYIGNAIFVFLLSVALYKHLRVFITFFLLCGSFSNLLDELFFDPKTLGYNELALLIIIPAIWLYKNRNVGKVNGTL